MKNKKFMYRLNIMHVIISIVGFIGFLITALIVREKQNLYLIWFLLAGIFLLSSIISLYLLIRFVKTDDYKKLIKLERTIGLEKIKSKNKIKNYILKNEFDLEKILLGYNKDITAGGKIFYKKAKNIYKKNKTAYDIFYLVKSNKNSFVIEKESEKIKSYSNEIMNFFKSKNVKADFVNCVIVFIHENLEEKEKDFYYSFIGLWEADMESDKFIMNQSFTYCGVDKSNNHVYFYKPLNSDGGIEVDLNFLIIKELHLDKN